MMMKRPLVIDEQNDEGINVTSETIAEESVTNDQPIFSDIETTTAEDNKKVNLETGSGIKDESKTDSLAKSLEAQLLRGSLLQNTKRRLFHSKEVFMKVTKHTSRQNLQTTLQPTTLISALLEEASGDNIAGNSDEKVTKEVNTAETITETPLDNANKENGTGSARTKI